MSGPGFWSVVVIFWLLALADGLWSTNRSAWEHVMALGAWCLVAFTMGWLWTTF